MTMLIFFSFSGLSGSLDRAEVRPVQRQRGDPQLLGRPVRDSEAGQPPLPAPAADTHPQEGDHHLHQPQGQGRGPLRPLGRSLSQVNPAWKILTSTCPLLTLIVWMHFDVFLWNVLQSYCLLVVMASQKFIHMMVL